MYNIKYDTPDIRNIEYRIAEHIIPYYNGSEIALDIGCGTCRKILPLSTKVSHYYGVDHNPAMLRKAKANIKQAGIENITVHWANNFYLPFYDNSMDIVSGFLTQYSIEEVFRVLKNEGLCILELLGVNDKRELKKAFGEDDLGWRGCMLTQNSDERVANLRSIFEMLFSSVHIEVVSYETRINRNELETLLQITPTIRGFSIKKDKNILDSLCDDDNLISFTEEKLIIIARK